MDQEQVETPTNAFSREGREAADVFAGRSGLRVRFRLARVPLSGRQGLWCSERPQSDDCYANSPQARDCRTGSCEAGVAARRWGKRQKVAGKLWIGM